MDVLAVQVDQKALPWEYLVERPGSEVRAERSKSEMEPVL